MGKVIVVLLIILVVVVALALVVVASGLVVWGASGLGWLLIHWLRMPFSPFEATLLSLIALVATVWTAMRLVVGLVTLPTGPHAVEDKDEDEDWEDDEDEDEDWDEDEDEDEEPEVAQHVPSIPKWRQPIRRASDRLPIVGPDDRCPCGSGRKYKNCHGRKK